MRHEIFRFDSKHLFDLRYHGGQIVHDDHSLTRNVARKREAGLSKAKKVTEFGAGERLR